MFFIDNYENIRIIFNILDYNTNKNIYFNFSKNVFLKMLIYLTVDHAIFNKGSTDIFLLFE